jgi:DNA polymerase-1
MDDGTPVNAVRVFATMLINLKKQFNPNKMLVAFDERGGGTHRHQYEFYKAGRADQPQELYDQIPMVKEFLELYGITHHAEFTLEADDIIGIVANTAKQTGCHVDIVTTDKDLLQLVDTNVNVYLSKTGVSNMELHTIENFRELNDGLTPKQIIDFKGIAGDSSDNLKGVKGIGPKGAIKLISEYDTLEAILENIDNHSESIRKKLNESREDALLSKELAKILVEGEVKIDLENLNLEEPK